MKWLLLKNFFFSLEHVSCFLLINQFEFDMSVVSLALSLYYQVIIVFVICMKSLREWVFFLYVFFFFCFALYGRFRSCFLPGYSCRLSPGFELD